MASEFAAVVHDQLNETLGNKACSSCLAGALNIERWDVLRGIRELILTGRVRADTDDCGVCRRRELVATLLPLYGMGARE